MIGQQSAAGAPAISSAAAVARRVYVIGVYVLVAAVVVQFLFAGLGIFYGGDFLQVWHAVVGALTIGLLSLALTGVGALGRLRGRTLWLTASVFGLVVLQSLLLTPFHMEATGAVRAISALHVVNALLIFYVVLRLAANANALRRAG
jgi:hypothetical protein